MEMHHKIEVLAKCASIEVGSLDTRTRLERERGDSVFLMHFHSNNGEIGGRLYIIT